jgi:hypothetical protein
VYVSYACRIARNDQFLPRTTALDVDGRPDDRGSLTKRYGETETLAGVDFSVQGGTTVSAGSHGSFGFYEL